MLRVQNPARKIATFEREGEVTEPTGPVCDRPQAHGTQLNFSATLPVGELVTKEFDFLHVTPPMSAPDFIRS